MIKSRPIIRSVKFHAIPANSGLYESAKTKCSTLWLILSTEWNKLVSLCNCTATRFPVVRDSHDIKRSNAYALYMARNGPSTRDRLGEPLYWSPGKHAQCLLPCLPDPSFIRILHHRKASFSSFVVQIHIIKHGRRRKQLKSNKQHLLIFHYGHTPGRDWGDDAIMTVFKGRAVCWCSLLVNILSSK